MAVRAANLKFYLSGGQFNDDPEASLGGVRSDVEWAGETIHDLFDPLTTDQSTQGYEDYRCVYFRNEDATSLTVIEAWLSAQPASDVAYAIALAAEGKNGTAELLATETQTPATVTFTAPSEKGSGLSIGTLAQYDEYAIWIRRTANEGSSYAAAATATLRCEGTSA